MSNAGRSRQRTTLWRLPTSSASFSHAPPVSFCRRARRGAWTDAAIETDKRFHTLHRAPADSDLVTVELDQSVLAAGIHLLTDIGRDLPLLVVGGVAIGGALVGWIAASRRAAAAERRLDEIDKQLEGPSARDLCDDLAKIITPYRENRIGKPIEDRLPPERRFLRNLRVQLRLSRQRRQRIEAMHAENLAECTRLREELESIRRAADEAVSSIARVTMVPPTLDAPEVPVANNETIDPVGEAPPSPVDATPAESSPAEVSEPNAPDDVPSPVDVEQHDTPADHSPDEIVDDDVADLVFSALDDPAAEEPDIAPMTDDVEAIDAIDMSPAATVDEEPTDEPIDFDTLLAESAARHGLEPVDDDALGGVAAFEQQLAEAGYGPDAVTEGEQTDEVEEAIEPGVDDMPAETDTTESTDASAGFADDSEDATVTVEHEAAEFDDTNAETDASIGELTDASAPSADAADTVADADTDEEDMSDESIVPSDVESEVALTDEVTPADASMDAEVVESDVDIVASENDEAAVPEGVEVDQALDVEAAMMQSADATQDVDDGPTDVESLSDAPETDVKKKSTPDARDVTDAESSEIEDADSGSESLSQSPAEMTNDADAADRADFSDAESELSDVDRESIDASVQSAPDSMNDAEEAMEPTEANDIEDVASATCYDNIDIESNARTDDSAEDAIDDMNALIADSIDDDSAESDFSETTDATEPIDADIEVDVAPIESPEAVLEPVVQADAPASSAADEAFASADRARAEIAAAIERADMSRQQLETLDASLNENLAHRRDMIARIDSALAERQIQLVTDILRAEAEHLSLTEALDQIRGSVEAIQGDIERVIGTPSEHKSDNPDNPPSA